MYKNTHFPTVRLKVEKTFKDFTKNILSCPGECGKSGKSLLWSLTVYDKKDLVKLHCWDPHRCPQVPVVPWAWSAHCPENSHPSPTGTLGLYLSSSRKMLRKGGQSSRSGWRQQTVSKVNQVFKHVRLLWKWKIWSWGHLTGVLGSNRHNQGAPQSLPLSQQRSHTQALEFSFICLSQAARLECETPFSAMILHCCPMGMVHVCLQPMILHHQTCSCML